MGLIGWSSIRLREKKDGDGGKVYMIRCWLEKLFIEGYLLVYTRFIFVFVCLSRS